MNKILKSLIKGLLVSVAAILLQKVWLLESTSEVMKVLCNSFFCVGVFILCMGLISFLSQEGVFDIFGFSLSLVFSTFKRNVSDRKYKTYVDYKQAKHPEGSKTTVSPHVFSGLILTAVGLIFLLFYYLFA